MVNLKAPIQNPAQMGFMEKILPISLLALNISIFPLKIIFSNPFIGMLH